MLKEIVLSTMILSGCVSKKINGVWVEKEPFPQITTEDGIRVSKGLHYYFHVAKFDFTGDGVDDDVVFFHAPFNDASTLNVLRKERDSLIPVYHEKLNLELYRLYILKIDDFDGDGVKDFSISRGIEGIENYYTWEDENVKKYSLDGGYK
ncbi:MAG: hypothetical protein CMH64_03900 [Nanoarchaeota archaeon]|nr:hypothetical protein [Nanoarchaeota archaeon]